MLEASKNEKNKKSKNSYLNGYSNLKWLSSYVSSLHLTSSYLILKSTLHTGCATSKFISTKNLSCSAQFTPFHFLCLPYLALLLTIYLSSLRRKHSHFGPMACLLQCPFLWRFMDISKAEEPAPKAAFKRHPLLHTKLHYKYEYINNRKLKLRKAN